ncbi:GTP pyrophosphokinase [Lutibacter sp. B2]|nr:GTP pyrophosphokinase [Lutibacter sp. B2]
MELKMFSFIEEVREHLEKFESEFEIISKDIELYFEKILLSSDKAYLNIESRVKSVSSLKEKILRNNYYKKYNSCEELISNLSDLIGIRIGCRFIEDENEIYKVLKMYFKEIHSDGYYYNFLNENIRLELGTKQPQEQKNGFKIFRIDGVYEYDNKRINFELQIKSLVNIFWGEIEHKVIYKNNNYMLADNFFKDIMGSIKKNLSMIDNQLLLIDNHFNKMNTINPIIRKKQLQSLFSKIIYDIFSIKMKDNIGLVVDFRRSCDAIMQYIFRSKSVEDLNDNESLIKMMSRFNDISKNEIDFNSEITFERDLLWEDEFSGIIGDTIVTSLNSDFHWNLFFRILFEIEGGNSAEDFITFINFFKSRFYENKSFSKLYIWFEKEQAKDIIDLLIKKIADSFKKIDSINFIHCSNIEKVNEIIDTSVDLICIKTNYYREWERNKDIYLDLFELKILSNFDYKIETVKVKNFIRKVKECHAEIEISEDVFKYTDQLEKVDKIKAEDVVKWFIM